MDRHYGDAGPLLFFLSGINQAAAIGDIFGKIFDHMVQALEIISCDGHPGLDFYGKKIGARDKDKIHLVSFAVAVKIQVAFFPWLNRYFSASATTMTYIPQESKVIYQSKDGKEEKAFDALEWLAAMCSHVPNKGEQMVRYYGHYSNVSRGKRKKEDRDEIIPSILEPVEDPDFSGDGSSKEFRRNWARLIQKIGARPGLDPGKWTP
mgnify:CR=1 FL=1